MAKMECPKCGGRGAWLERDTQDVTLRCLCGFRKVIYTTLEQATILNTTPRDEIRLPKTGTHLSKTLRCLRGLTKASSAEVTQTLRDLGNQFTVSSVSSYLTILRSMGLVETTESRRGLPGGSTWALTPAASSLLGE